MRKLFPSFFFQFYIFLITVRSNSPTVTEHCYSKPTAAPECGRLGSCSPGRHRGDAESPCVPLNRHRADRQPTSPSPCPLSSTRQVEAIGHDALLGHEAIMHGFHVIFHFVRSRKFLAAHRTWKHLALVALVVEKRVPLKAVFVFEGLLDVELRALGALIYTLADGRVTEEIQAAHRHLRQLLGGVLRLRCSATSHASLWGLTTARRRHRAGAARCVVRAGAACTPRCW